MTETLNELPAVARNINLPCKKCGVDRYFVVVAHTSPTSAKVKCEVCGAQKTFKLGAEKKEKKAKTPGVGRGNTLKEKAIAKRAAEYNALFADLKKQIGMDNIQPYEMKKKYAMASAVKHPKFGMGFVTSVTADKIEVAFEDGARSLVHNRT
jgi:hypothetical protein